MLILGWRVFFGQVFSLHDSVLEAVPVQESVERGQVSLRGSRVLRRGSQVSRSGSQVSLLSAAFLLIMLALWTVSDVLAVAVPSLRLYIIGFAIVASTPGLILVDILIFATVVEITALIWIGFHETPFSDKLGAGILSMLAIAADLGLFSDGEGGGAGG